MHPNARYHEVSDEQNFNFAVHRGFGTWVAITDDDSSNLLIATAPFYHEAGKLKAHLVRSNPLAERMNRQSQRNGIKCTLIVSGPDSYISPDWYGLDDQVPTWNYVSVHIHGWLKLLPDCELRPILDNLSETFESRISDTKPVWKSTKVDASKMTAMMRAIVPIEFTIDKIQGTWKLGQAKPQGARSRVAAELAGLNLINSLEPLALGMEQELFSRIHEREFMGNHRELIECRNMLNKQRTKKNDTKFYVPFWAFLSVCVALIISLSY